MIVLLIITFLIRMYMQQGNPIEIYFKNTKELKKVFEER